MFSKILHDSTIHEHSKVDKHPFVEKIKINKVAGNLYINFNKVCLDVIQKNNKNEFIKSLHKDIFIETDFYINNDVNKLLERCKMYPFEHGYMFGLGLLYGGNMLKKYLPEHTEFLTFTDSKNKIKLFKETLDEITDVDEQNKFIKVVNDSYEIIYRIFETFNNRINKK